MTTRAEILKRYGIVERPELMVRATKEADVLWRVAINAQGDPLTAIDVGHALKLSEELRRAGEEALAARIVMAIDEARKSQAQRLWATTL